MGPTKPMKWGYIGFSNCKLIGLRDVLVFSLMARRQFNTVLITLLQAIAPHYIPVGFSGHGIIDEPLFPFDLRG